MNSKLFFCVTCHTWPLVCWWIQSVNLITCVYTPGRFCRAHPSPQLTMPARNHLRPRSRHTSGPPESPCMQTHGDIKDGANLHAEFSHTGTHLTGIDSSLYAPCTYHSGSHGIVVHLVARFVVDDAYCGLLQQGGQLT